MSKADTGRLIRRTYTNAIVQKRRITNMLINACECENIPTALRATAVPAVFFLLSLRLTAFSATPAHHSTPGE